MVTERLNHLVTQIGRKNIKQVDLVHKDTGNTGQQEHRNWEMVSTASSFALVAKYTSHKLFKEPSSKSNRPNIYNAIIPLLSG